MTLGLKERPLGVIRVRVLGKERVAIKGTKYMYGGEHTHMGMSFTKLSSINISTVTFT